MSTDKFIEFSTIGHIQEFNLEENWKQWYERLNQYFIVNEFQSLKRFQYLLH